jgi:hypothetical protein
VAYTAIKAAPATFVTGDKNAFVAWSAKALPPWVLDHYADPDGNRFIYHVGGFECRVKVYAIPGDPERTEERARRVADVLNRLYAHERS